MKKLTKILCALLVVLTMSCAKDGATGPQGPAGTCQILQQILYIFSKFMM